MRSFIKIAVFLLIAHALYRFVPPYWNDTTFRREVKETAIEWRELSEQEIADEMLALAADHRVPITKDHLNVRSRGNRIIVDVSYGVPIEFLPRWKKRWTFDSTIEAWTLVR